MIEKNIVCDECSGIIDSTSGRVTDLRWRCVKYGLMKRRDGRDLCHRCFPKIEDARRATRAITG